MNFIADWLLVFPVCEQTSDTPSSPSSSPPACRKPPVNQSHTINNQSRWLVNNQDVSRSHLLPDGDVGLQLLDAVLDRLLAVTAVRRRDRHDNTGLAHLHPPEGRNPQVSLTSTFRSPELLPLTAQVSLTERSESIQTHPLHTQLNNWIQFSLINQ